MHHPAQACRPGTPFPAAAPPAPARRADDIASGAATVGDINTRRAAAPDSDVVARYKADQQKVIAAASA